MSNSMSIKTYVEVSKRLPVGTSTLLRGPHGIGKSQLVREVAEHYGLPVVDRRLSQMTEGDMIGLPSTDGECTRFNPPDWFKECCTFPRALFLDEINRATPEVMQASFQISLDRELNGWKLHKDTRIFAAVNSSAAYNVNEMDPALLDRFWTIDLEPTVADWVNWAKKDNRVHDNVIHFILANEKWLDSPKDAEPSSVNPSRRSWERLSQALVGAGIAETPEDVLFYPICTGYIGTMATIAFTSFVKTIDNQVSGEEVLNSYEKVAAKVKRLGQEKQNIVIEKLTDYITKSKNKTFTDKQGQNLGAFMKDLPGELRVAAWGKMTQAAGSENIESAKWIHKHCIESVLEVYGVAAADAVKALSTAGTDKTATKKKSKKVSP